MKYSAALINGCFAALFGYTLYYDYELPKKFRPIPDLYISKFAWLTMVNLLIQLVYHVLATFLALTHGTLMLPKFKRAVSFVSTAIGFPISLTVVVLFWGLYFYDPNTLFKDAEAKLLLTMVWFNHSLHTAPGLAMILDFWAWKHQRPSKTNAIKAILIFSALYLADVHLVYFISGFWAYPILGQLAFYYRMLFIGFCTAVIFSAFLVGDTYNSYLQGTNKKVDRKRKRR